MAAQPVHLEIVDGIARLHLNRAEASNALNQALLAALVDAVRAIQRDVSTRVVVITAEGKNFCGGGDVVEFVEHGTGLPGHLRELTAMQESVIGGLVNLTAPVVALIHGAATGGGGTALVCACDIVLAGPGARFMLGVTRVGMGPDGGVSTTLSQMVGLRQALRLALLNPMLGPEEALEIGLVTEVCSNDEALRRRGEEVIQSLASGSAAALGETKRLFRQGAQRSLEESLPDESRTVARLSGTPDAREGLAAVVQRRAPRFKRA
jgi:2-(1,2-epoxy-1,2-dihydrophenyl)acetyl-CoA isomerase